MPRKSIAQLEIERLVRRQSLPIRNAFHAYCERVKSPATLQLIIARLRDRDIQGALDLLDEHVVTFADVLPRVFLDVGRSEIKTARIRFGGGIGVQFNPGDKAAAALIESSRLNLIREFSRSQKDVVRRVLARSLRRGDGAREAARKFRNVVGLTNFQEMVVDNYQSLLETNSRGALDRALRHRRYDGTIESAIEDNVPLSASLIERMVGAYRTAFIGYRAENIARTESQRVVHQARHSAWQQAATAAGIKPSTVIRTWMTVGDNRVRDTHEGLDGTSVEGFDEPFISESGEELMYPGDPNASAAETCQCRCSLLFERK